jgi:hypothetical protein
MRARVSSGDQQGGGRRRVEVGGGRGSGAGRARGTAVGGSGRGGGVVVFGGEEVIGRCENEKKVVVVCLLW